MKTLTIRLEDSEYMTLKKHALSKRMSMTALIMQQLDTLGITKPPQVMQETDDLKDLEFVND
jgi:predicted DNA-binding ribbon-helix-helix protein